VSFLIVGTFIDFEHFIIPDRVTIGGTIAGVVCSVVVPALMQTDSRVAAGVRAALAAALGYVILWIVLEAGKIAFGRKRIEFDAPTTCTWKKRGDDADFVVGTDESLWSEYFAREKDRLLLQSNEVRIGYACRRKGCLVRQTSIWTVSRIPRAGVVVFWRHGSALVRNAAQPIMRLPCLTSQAAFTSGHVDRAKANRIMRARKSPRQWKQLWWKPECEFPLASGRRE